MDISHPCLISVFFNAYPTLSATTRVEIVVASQGLRVDSRGDRAKINCLQKNLSHPKIPHITAIHWAGRYSAAALLWVGRYSAAALLWVGRYSAVALLGVGRYSAVALLWVGRYLAVALLWVGRYLAAALLWVGRYLAAALLS